MPTTKPKTIAQCKSCPWRVGCEPDKDIPNGYSCELHEKLRGTIQSGEDSLRGLFSSNALRMMACHYSKPGEEFPCAGWLENQIVGNNIAVRLMISVGRLPAPICDGPQHETFDDTLPKKKRKKRK